jgi:uncharacterized Zn-finger protein
MSRAPAVVTIAARDMPAYCPNPDMPRWSWHPRVFLDIATTGSALCPYCGTMYALKPGEKVRDGHCSECPD